MKVNYVRKIGRLDIVENFESDDRYFEIYALSNRKPVESFENRSDVVRATSGRDDDTS